MEVLLESERLSGWPPAVEASFRIPLMKSWTVGRENEDQLVLSFRETVFEGSGERRDGVVRGGEARFCGTAMFLCNNEMFRSLLYSVVGFCPETVMLPQHKS